jgi:toxin-antitoxin system PIN domain toxin
VPGSLFDTNVWLAAVFTTHPFHPQAQQALRQASAAEPAVFCRATQQSFLRLASTPALLKAYGADGLTNRDALVALDALQGLPQVVQRDEPPGVLALWRTLATHDTASPKVWMDAYLAAFAIAGGLRMVTLDRDFNTHVPRGLNLALLNPA